MDFTEAYDDTCSSVGLASRMGDSRALKELLQAGHPTNGHDNRGWRPLHEAAEGGHVECVRLLLMADDVEIDALTHESTTALHLACGSGPSHSEVVRLLLSAGADPSMVEGDNWSLPLPKAVAYKNLDIVRLLLDAGADPNCEDYESGRPLHVAAEKGLLEIAQLLLERGAKVDKVDDFSRTALHVCMYRQSKVCGALPVLNLLLDKGSDVNARMDGGTTPLMLAVQSNWSEAVMKLLERGADVDIMKRDGVLALHFAIQFCPDNSELQPYSKSDNSGSDSEVGSTSILEEILSLTSKELIIPKTDDVIEYSLCHLAVEWDRFNTLKTLVEDGVPPDKFLQGTSNAVLDEADVDLFCQVPLVLSLGITVDTPLSFLLSKPLTRQRLDIAKFMITKGSCVNAVNQNCLPPLVAAVKHQRASYSEGGLGHEIVRYLLDHGADIMYKIRDKDLLPVALYVSSLFNVVAFFLLLREGVPAHQIFTSHTLKKLSEWYRSSAFYTLYTMFPWRVISWLHTLNLFVPQLPLDTRLLYDQGRMVEDENLTIAWNNVDAVIGSPKSLQQLCVLAVRCAIREARGWTRLSSSLDELQCMESPLPPIIMDLLQFRQIETETLYRSPPRSAMPSYLTAESPNDSHTSEEEEEDNQMAFEESEMNEMDSTEEEDGTE
ncbi:uncharacterized protein [Panulirus ornatus]|uniref:uncharacterized protein n=1 Tax=Panulirus ornatus TaxID=150431 RepID=UPI003A87DC58